VIEEINEENAKSGWVKHHVVKICYCKNMMMNYVDSSEEELSLTHFHYATGKNTNRHTLQIKKIFLH
jgi:hypothetical protein